MEFLGETAFSSGLSGRSGSLGSRFSGEKLEREFYKFSSSMVRM